MPAARIGQVLFSALLALLATLHASPLALAADGEACGTLIASTTWSGAVTVTCDVFVPAGLSLTVSPGTTVRFREWARIEVSGNLNANGSSAPITFTSDQTAPVPRVVARHRLHRNEHRDARQRSRPLRRQV
ncbi:MAG: hypothetical protein FJ313_05590, partial [Gemmatimonadetes bacterium]|nr:hypothetical protein [Gemmatimonadota bacterium]